MFNDSTGKTSATLFCGWMIVMSSCGGFVSAGFTMMVMTIFKLEGKPEIIAFHQMMVMQSIAFATIGATLLGVHRFTNDQEVKENKEEVEIGSAKQ